MGGTDASFGDSADPRVCADSLGAGIRSRISSNRRASWVGLSLGSTKDPLPARPTIAPESSPSRQVVYISYPYSGDAFSSPGSQDPQASFLVVLRPTPTNISWEGRPSRHAGARRLRKRGYPPALRLAAGAYRPIRAPRYGASRHVAESPGLVRRFTRVTRPIEFLRKLFPARCLNCWNLQRA